MFASKKTKGWRSALPSGSSSVPPTSQGIDKAGHQFSLLPAEILQFLSVRDLCSAVLVCRQWQELIQQLPQWNQAKHQFLGSAQGRGVRSKRMNDVEDNMYKIVMLGPGGSGRCSFVVRFALKTFLTDYDPVIENTYSRTLSVNGVTATANLLVTAGQEEYRSLVDGWIQEAEGILVLYSVTKRSSVEEAESYLEQIYRSREGGLPIIVLGNKLDLAEEREVAPDEGKALADRWAAYSWGCDPERKGKEDKFRFARNFFECSAKEGYVVEYNHDAFKAWSSIPRADQPPAESADGKWRIHRGDMEVVFEELVRQIDMYRAAMKGDVLFADKPREEKKCLLM